MNKCRVCGHKIYEEPLLRYEGMPNASQFLPDFDSISSDTPVDLEICQCTGCGLIQLNNEPVPYYREVIRAAAISEEMKDFRRKQFHRFVKKYSLTGKKIIEIGCGRGEYMSLMQQCSVNTYGIEYSTESVRQCTNNGLNVSKDFIESSTQKLCNAPFDAFYILNYLEHLPNITSALRGIYNNLSVEAVGLVEVPNFGMILRNKLFSEFTRDHLFYFTKETLDTTLRQNGFEIMDYQEVWYKYIISVTVKKRKKLDVSNFYIYQEKLKNEIGKYLNSLKDKKIAIWGAGHQALAVISLANLAGKIKYVIDSALFKQGKLTPASHIPIVSPDTLNSDPVDAIIIMAAGYSDEVSRIIQQNYDRKIQISILRDYGLEVL